MITIVNSMIRMASLMSAIAGLYLLPGSPLQSLLPSARSAVLVSLPHAWRSLLSWITPPCLFLILNCIIVTLALTSGSFNGPSSADSGLDANFVMKMEAVHRHTDHSLPKACKKLPAHGVPAQITIACKELEKEKAATVQHKRTKNNDDDGLAMAASDPTQKAWHSQPTSPSQKPTAKCVRRAKSCHSSSMHVLSTNRKHANRHGFRSLSSASGSYTSSASASLSPPSSSATTSSWSSSCTLSTLSSPTSSLSRCSADYDSQSAHTVSDLSHADDLSDEDLRKRIEAFISRMNAHMRTEATTSIGY